MTFDTLFQDSSGQAQKLEGVTQFFQQDAQLAELLLDYICHEPVCRTRRLRESRSTF